MATFRDLVQKSSIFLDKTLLIKEFLEYPSQVLLIICPRQFCKTINMSMIKTFLEIEVTNESFELKDKEKTPNYMLFKGEIPREMNRNKHDFLERPLNIGMDLNMVENYLGRFPVIYINFGRIHGNDYATIDNGIKYTICDSFQEHLYLINILE